MSNELIIARIVLVLISVSFLIIFTKILISKRIGSHFFIIIIIFWGSVLFVSIKPEILDFIISSFGLDNRAQILLTISIFFVIYLLVMQISRNKGLSTNLFQVIRKVAFANFKEQINLEKNPDLIIVIQAKNEENMIGSVIDKIQSQKIPLSYEILVVNDGSTDKTEQIAKSKGAYVINHEYNLGIGGAVKTSFLASKLFSPKIVINIDGDGQHDPKFIPIIISKINAGADIVFCSRFQEKLSSETTKIRFFGNKFYTNLTNKLTGLSLTDVTTGYRGIKFDKIGSIFFVSENNFAIELAFRTAKNKLKVEEISISQIARTQGQSQFHKIEKFIIYNINSVIQIFNAYFRNPKFEL